MKKIQLSIPKPCYENWNAMTQEDKGRFCGSCQKTVVDFSAMSDRQLAEFFKKPVDSVCGRFHNDQLEREIEIPKKRIPWVKYFFQFTWPALVLFLKSCGQREVVAGELAPIETPVTKAESDVPLATMGIVLEEITPVDSVLINRKPKAVATQEDLYTVGEIAPPPVMGDTVILPVQEPVIMGKIAMPVDSVAKRKPVNKPASTQTKSRCKIEAIKNDNSGFAKVPFSFQPSLPQAKELSTVSEQEVITLGGVWATGVSRKKKKPETKVIVNKEKQPVVSSFFIYPNPAVANSIVSIRMASLPEGRYLVSLIDAAGATVQQSFVVIKKESATFQFAVKQLSAGSYFLRLANDNTNTSYTETLLVR